MYDEKPILQPVAENVVMALSLIDSLDDDEYLLIASHIHIDEQEMQHHLRHGSMKPLYVLIFWAIR